MNRLEARLKECEPLWGNWRIVRRIFSGSNSSVFLIQRDRRGETLYSALKVVELLPRDDSDLDARLESALEEIRRMELFSDCPWIVGLKDDEIVENGEGGFELRMRLEYLSCLETMMREEQLPEDLNLVQLAVDLCRGLDCAHRRGILHRDVKPANIYRSDVGVWKLGDFGASRRLAFGDVPSTITGTTAYMAPEIGKGEEWGPWSDIYGLGIVLYQLLNGGFLPLTDENSNYGDREQAILRRWNGEELPPPNNGDPALQSVVLRACRRKPEERYRTAGEMLRDLIPLLSETERREGSALSAPAHSLETEGERGNEMRNRRRMPVAAVVALALSLSALGFSAGWYIGGKGEANQPSVASRDGHRYEVITRKATWESAKIYCESQGGHLATITSREEEKLILDLLEDTDVTIAWLGADNYNSSGGFRWVTGEEFEYASWGIGEPNNTGGQEHCLMLVKSTTQGWVWNDAPNNGHDFYKLKEIGFICEWE